MDFDLYLSSKLVYSDFQKVVIDILTNTMNINVKISEDKDGTYICHNYFTFDLSKDDFGLDYIEEEFGMKANLYIDIDLFSKTAIEGLKLLFQFIGNLIRELNVDIFFLGDVSMPIIKSIKGKLEVYKRQEEYFFELPFESLGLPYHVVD